MIVNKQPSPRWWSFCEVLSNRGILSHCEQLLSDTFPSLIRPIITRKAAISPTFPTFIRTHDRVFIFKPILRPSEIFYLISSTMNQGIISILINSCLRSEEFILSWSSERVVFLSSINLRMLPVLKSVNCRLNHIVERILSVKLPCLIHFEALMLIFWRFHWLEAQFNRVVSYGHGTLISSWHLGNTIC